MVLVPLKPFVKDSRLEGGAPAQCGEATSVVRHEPEKDDTIAGQWIGSCFIVTRHH